MEDKHTTFSGRIIIIHDAAELSERLASWLVKNHYQYTVVSSVEEATELMETGDCDEIMNSKEFRFIKRSR